ncbi:MAG: lysophospholipid acyltransferase family protein [Cyanobacteria bacterium P01_H01_bin.153]
MAAISLPLVSPWETPSPLDLSRGLIQLLGTKLIVSGRQRIPHNVPTIVVSNHRSPLDGPVLMAGLNRDVAFVCHQYMEHVPLLRDIVRQFGAFPLDTPHRFFRQGYQRLRRREMMGIFPEGARPMVEIQPPRQVNPFHRGFAHLALRVPIEPLALLPVALVSDDKGIESPIPLSLLGWFDPSEPLFQQGGGHPLVFYRRVEVRVGEPIWLTASDREHYQGRHGTEFAQQLTDSCWTAVNHLLQR